MSLFHKPPCINEDSFTFWPLSHQRRGCLGLLFQFLIAFSLYGHTAISDESSFEDLPPCWMTINALVFSKAEQPSMGD